MPIHLRTYDNIGDAHSFTDHTFHFFNEGLSYANTIERYGYPYESIRSRTRAFEKNDQLAPKHRGGVHYPIFPDEHIQ